MNDPNTDIEDIILNREKNSAEERKEIIEELFERTESYIKTNVSLFKLKTIDKVATGAAALADRLVLVLLCFFFLLMMSVGIAIWLGQVLGKMHWGFMMVGGFYALLIIGYILFGKRVFKPTLRQAIISDLVK